jgi:hypothetical protein
MADRYPDCDGDCGQNGMYCCDGLWDVPELGTRWRDEQGNLYRVYGIHATDDARISLRYIEPTPVKTLPLSELRQSHVAIPRKEQNDA